MSAEQLRIRSYLQAQARKLTHHELVEKVRADQEQVRLAAEAVPPARFAERPAAGEWSANEVMAHVVGGAVSLGAAIAATINGGTPPTRIRDEIEGDQAVRTATEWWTDLAAARAALFARVSRASGEEHLDVTWTHPMFGALTWREWLLFLRIHDLDHARQMQAITAALG